jgi:hypothetical protein
VTRRMTFALAVLASPFLTLAQPSGGSCAYSSDASAAQGLTFCTQVSSEGACTAEAAKKASPKWLEAHPPRFQPGGDCTDGGKALKKTSTKKGAKGSAKPAKKDHAKPPTTSADAR